MEIKINAAPEEFAILLMKMGANIDITEAGKTDFLLNGTGNKIPKRMRTVEEAYNLLKSEDPETAVSKNHIYRIVKQQLIPVTYAGKKQLIDYDCLLEYLSAPHEQMPSCKKEQTTGTIRKIM